MIYAIVLLSRIFLFLVCETLLLQKWGLLYHNAA